MAKLQSSRNINVIAKSSLIISILTTFISCLLYYKFNNAAIVLVLILQSVISFCVLSILNKQKKIVNFKYSFFEIFNKSKPIISLGFYLTINLIFGYICTYLIKIFIKYYTNSIEIVGFYEVGCVILITYVGLIFNSMATDYFPRLTFSINDSLLTNKIVNEQIEIGLILITPLVLFFYCFLNTIVTFLYSNQFLQVVEFLKYGLFSSIIKSIIWPLAFVILANDNKKLYFKQEILGDFLNVFFSILFFYLFGLKGLGIALLLNFTILWFLCFFYFKNKI